jgi:hypothetical protein
LVTFENTQKPNWQEDVLVFGLETSKHDAVILRAYSTTYNKNILVEIVSQEFEDFIGLECFFERTATVDFRLTAIYTFHTTRTAAILSTVSKRLPLTTEDIMS